MRILLSTIGSRGDVQPILALGLELRRLGHEARICAPPTFKEWIDSFGLEFVPIGPDVMTFRVASAPSKPFKMTKAMRQQLADGTVREQFRVLPEAARGCDMIVGATALQLAAPSVAASLGIPYVFAAYAPVVLPSPDHPPPKFGTPYPQWLPGVVNRALWMRDARSFNKFRGSLNEERAKLGLAPVDNVRPYIFTDSPWLAADPALGPAPTSNGTRIVQTGAWLLSDPTPLPEDLERFLASGDPPIYFGFGSMRDAENAGRAMIEAARALGRRAIVSKGWANLDTLGAGADVIAIGDVAHERLFPRVAAVVHHGGAGTTTAVARAGRPQVLVPHNYDQFYWSHRMRTLGVGVSGLTQDTITAEGLTSALREALRPEMAARALELARRVKTDGAEIAARRLLGA